jgi:hypothetical protein
MAEKSAPSLYELATEIEALAQSVLQGADLRQRRRDLHERQEQLANLQERAARVLGARDRLALAGVKIKPSRSKLKAKVAALEKLENEASKSIELLLEPDALDQKEIVLGLEQIEAGLLEGWKNKINPLEETGGMAEVATGMPGLAATARQLTKCREELNRVASRLPDTSDTVAVGLQLRSDHDALVKKLSAAGLDDKLLAFLQHAGRSSGIPLDEVLKDKTVWEWINSKNHAASFRLKLDSGSSPQFLK